MTQLSSLKRFPALQAEIGDWDYYITSLKFSEIAERVRSATELVTPPDMNHWIQRSIVDIRAGKIADYLLEQEQHFFPGIVVGVYLGEPTWYAIDVEGNTAFSIPDLDSGSKFRIGLLELDGTERLYAIDGQHRIAGIKEALSRLKEKDDLENYNRLANEDLSVVFVSADIDREGELERVRRLFTTLNKEAKKVSEPEIVALDEDDAAAIVTRWIAIRYAGLRGDTSRGDTSIDRMPDANLIQMGTRHEIPPTNHSSVTTIVTLYRMVKRVLQSELRVIQRKYKNNRPDEYVLQELYKEIVEIWEFMRSHDSALADVLGSDPREQRAMKYRGEEGGHILFRPIGLQAFAGALGLLRTRGIPNEQAVRSLCTLPMTISEVPWKHIVWNPNTRRIINGSRTISEALFLHMLGERPRSSRYDLVTHYREMLGNPSPDPFEQIPVFDVE